MALSTHIRDREKNKFRDSHDGTVVAVSEAGIDANGNTPGFAVVEATSTTIIPANTNRAWAILTNSGNNDVYVAVGQTALVSAGIILVAKGGTLVINKNTFTTAAINGITTAGTSRIVYQETERPSGL